MQPERLSIAFQTKSEGTTSLKHLFTIFLFNNLQFLFFSAGFIPHANKSTAHHMLLYGCTEPGTTHSVWYV